MPASLPRLHDKLDHRWAQRHMFAYLDGEFPGSRRIRMENHALRCPECGPMLRTLVILLWELQKLRASAPISVAPRVIERLRDEAAAGAGEGRG